MTSPILPNGGGQQLPNFIFDDDDVVVVHPFRRGDRVMRRPEPLFLAEAVKDCLTTGHANRTDFFVSKN